MGKEVFGIAITNSGGLHAGDTLKGTIWADFAKDTKGTALSVEFSGTEQTLVRHRREENNHPDNSAVSSDYYMRAVGKRNLILVNLPVESTSFIQANGTIPAGKYELPFTVDLPKILPSSCRAEFDGSYCEVVYRLEAEIQGSGIVQNYKAQMEVPIVAAPLTRDPIPYAVAPEMEAVTMFCCIPQGAITVAARVADTQLDQGETLNVGITGRNDSQTQISKITISLLQDCHWEAERYPMKKTDVLGSVQVDSSLVKRGTADERTLLQEVQDTTASFATPQTALPSYAGQLMRIQHFVEIVFATGMMKSNPTIRIPVQVGPAVAATTDFGDAVPEGFSGTKIDIPASNAVVLGNGGNIGDEKTVEGLIRGLEASVQDMAYISDCTEDTEWKTAVIGLLSATDYGRILKAVSSEFEQPGIAMTLAKSIGDFTCAHVVAALQNGASWSRASMTEKLLPMCGDLAINSGMIQSQLTEWEQMVTEPAFASALQAK